MYVCMNVCSGFAFVFAILLTATATVYAVLFPAPNCYAPK